MHRQWRQHEQQQQQQQQQILCAREARDTGRRIKRQLQSLATNIGIRPARLLIINDSQSSAQLIRHWTSLTTDPLQVILYAPETFLS